MTYKVSSPSVIQDLSRWVHQELSRIPAALGFREDDLTVQGDVTIVGDLDVSAITTDSYERHIQLAASLAGTPANQPTQVTVGTAGGLQFATTGTKYAYCTWEVPDDWDGTDIVIEIDWCPNSGAMTAPAAVKWDVSYRAVAEGELITAGTVATGTVTVNTSQPQYEFIHSGFTIAFDDANQPLTKQDHVFFEFSRDTGVANDFSGTAAITEFEILYNSVGLATSN